MSLLIEAAHYTLIHGDTLLIVSLTIFLHTIYMYREMKIIERAIGVINNLKLAMEY